MNERRFFAFGRARSIARTDFSRGALAAYRWSVGVDPKSGRYGRSGFDSRISNGQSQTQAGQVADATASVAFAFHGAGALGKGQKSELEAGCERHRARRLPSGPPSAPRLSTPERRFQT